MAEEKKIEVAFERDYEVQDHAAGTPAATRFRAKQKVKLAETSALHFIRRGLAIATGR